MVKLVTTSVVRGSEQGASHGGVYLIDLENRVVEQKLDWNAPDIEWRGRGGDRGLRGIAFDKETVYIAASDELFAFSPDFRLLGSWRNPYLRHCHEIMVYRRTLFLASTGYDSILGFELDEQAFNWGLYIETHQYKFKGTLFDPRGDEGPVMMNRLHINNVYCNLNGMYLSGLRTGGMLHYNGKTVFMAVELPAGSHNAQPFRDGVLFNDTNADCLRYSGRGEGEEDRALPVPKYDPATLTYTELDDSRIARAGFARGLCRLSETVVAGGSSPSTVTVYDLAGNERLMSANLTRDVRNAIHGLEVWPYG